MTYYVRINPLNKKQVYIGRTTGSILGRNHRDWASFHDKTLQSNLKKVYQELYDNKTDFDINILESTNNSEDFNIREQFWIDSFDNTYIILNYKKKASYNKSRSIVVSCYTLDGKLHKTFDSRLQACLICNINSTNMRKVLDGKTKQTAGFMWKDGKDKKIAPFDGRLRRHKIHQYKLTGEYVSEFISIQLGAEAAGLKHSSSIHAMLTGRVKTAGGFLWSRIKYSNYFDIKI